MPRFLATMSTLVLLASFVGACADREQRQDAAAGTETAVGEPPPAALTVVHTPNPATAQFGGRSGRAFTWQYATAVTAVSDDITIIEFGAETWRRGEWVMATVAGRPYSADQFAGWYGCPEARIPKGATVTDPRNFSGSSAPSLPPWRWYYVGVTAGGDTVRAEAAIEHVTLSQD